MLTILNKRQLLLAFFLGTSCINWDDSKPKEPPQITEQTPTEEALQHAIEHGGDVLNKTKELLQNRQACGTALPWLKAKLDPAAFQTKATAQPSIEDRNYIHSLHLYISCKDPEAPAQFQVMVRSQNPIVKRLAWVVAASLPSLGMANQVEAHLGHLVTSNTIMHNYLPELARALEANRLKGSYTILREGLLETGDPAFVEAMVSLNPQACSPDLLIYLSRADFEDLRQISIPKINIMTATLIFEHFMSYPPAIAQNEMPTLFLYAVSRNRPLAEMASGVLLNYLPAQTHDMALILSAMDGPVQMAFVEQVRRNINSELRLFLDELKLMTAKKEVIEEINALL